MAIEFLEGTSPEAKPFVKEVYLETMRKSVKRDKEMIAHLEEKIQEHYMDIYRIADRIRKNTIEIAGVESTTVD